MTAARLMVLIAGPNGAGKSTAAPSLLRDELAVEEFVNADTIASGLSAFRPESVAMTAGRLMLQRIRQLAAGRASFAFETTLASRSFAPWIVEVRRLGYHVHLLFLVLESADLAASRVAERVRMGGYAVSEPTIRRRYEGGLRNLFRLYLPLVDTWQVFDNSGPAGPRLLGSGRAASVARTADAAAWAKLVERYA